MPIKNDGFSHQDGISQHGFSLIDGCSHQDGTSQHGFSLIDMRLFYYYKYWKDNWSSDCGGKIMLINQKQ